MDANATQFDFRKPRIAAFGLFYAGKSSLLNMLANSIKKEIFSTCELGEPFVNHEHETEHFVLADAPNLDMLDEHGMALPPCFDQVDVPVLVHAPGDWELEELNWLRRAQETYGTHTNQRLVLVLTHRDKSRAGSAESQEIKLMAELQQLFGLTPACFSVSNSLYSKGMQEDRHDLVLASNLPLLRQHLHSQSIELARQMSHSMTPLRQIPEPAAPSHRFSGYKSEATA